MQNPKRDIEGVISKLIATQDPNEQKKAMTHYFAENAGFQSPVYKIAPHQQSREDALGVYQWLRIISPSPRFDATNIVFDEESKNLMVEGTIIFPIRFSPVQPKPAKVLIHMKLKKSNKAYLITSQDYYYHPDQLTNQVLPFISPVIEFALSTFAYASAVSAKFAQVMGIWRVNDGGKGDGANSSSYAQAHSSHTGEKRRSSFGSHSSDEVRIGASESHSGSERPADGEAWQSAKLNGKQRKRRDVSGQRHAVHS